MFEQHKKYTQEVEDVYKRQGLSAGLDFYIPEDFEAKQIGPGESINIDVYKRQ